MKMKKKKRKKKKKKNKKGEGWSSMPRRCLIYYGWWDLPRSHYGKCLSEKGFCEALARKYEGRKRGTAPPSSFLLVRTLSFFFLFFPSLLSGELMVIDGNESHRGWLIEFWWNESRFIQRVYGETRRGSSTFLHTPSCIKDFTIIQEPFYICAHTVPLTVTFYYTQRSLC